MPRNGYDTGVSVLLRCDDCECEVGAEEPLNEAVEISFLRHHYGHKITVHTATDGPVVLA